MIMLHSYETSANEKISACISSWFGRRQLVYIVTTFTMNSHCTAVMTQRHWSSYCIKENGMPLVDLPKKETVMYMFY